MIALRVLIAGGVGLGVLALLLIPHPPISSQPTWAELPLEVGPGVRAVGAVVAVDAGEVIGEGGAKVRDVTGVIRLPSISAYITYYHPDLHGGPLGCVGYGRYNQWDETVVAVNNNQSFRWPCGTRFIIEGPTGNRLYATRKDSCGGCAPNHLDLSTQGRIIVCGTATSCRAIVQWVDGRT